MTRETRELRKEAWKGNLERKVGDAKAGWPEANQCNSAGYLDDRRKRLVKYVSV
jgi:hypothetical protein